jgi:tetratricopeptide (TPR) repeat protein
MARLPHPAVLWVANLLVPGAGEALAGRLWLGPLLAAAWTALVLAAGYHLVFCPGAGSLTTAGVVAAAAAVVYAGGQASLALRLRAIRQWRDDPRRDAVFKEALAACLRGQWDESEAVCRRLLRADPDDVEATLQLASVARCRGRAGAARRYLLRARYLDDDGRWDFEIGRELAALAALAPPAAK